MENHRFDTLIRRLATRQSRRGTLALVSGLLTAPVIAGLSADAKKKNKVTLCLGGQTVQASKKKKKKLLKSGATLGGCPTPTTPPPLPGTSTTTTTPAPTFCQGKPDETYCGGEPFDWHFCSGGVCAEFPTCKLHGDPCGSEECCVPSSLTCNSTGLCSCSAAGEPCIDVFHCCGEGFYTCVGFVCQPV